MISRLSGGWFFFLFPAGLDLTTMHLSGHIGDFRIILEGILRARPSDGIYAAGESPDKSRSKMVLLKNNLFLRGHKFPFYSAELIKQRVHARILEWPGGMRGWISTKR